MAWDAIPSQMTLDKETTWLQRPHFESVCVCVCVPVFSRLWRRRYQVTVAKSATITFWTTSTCPYVSRWAMSLGKPIILDNGPRVEAIKLFVAWQSWIIKKWDYSNNGLGWRAKDYFIEKGPRNYVIAWADCLVTGGVSGHYSATCSSLVLFLIFL